MFQILIGILQTSFKISFRNIVFKVSNPYRYSTNTLLGLAIITIIEVSNPYRYSTNPVSGSIIGAYLKVSNPYRYSTNLNLQSIIVLQSVFQILIGILQTVELEA